MLTSEQAYPAAPESKSTPGPEAQKGAKCAALRPLLDNYAKSVGNWPTKQAPISAPLQGSEAESKGDANRVDRWAARGILWGMTTLPRVATCGRNSVRPSGVVEVRQSGETVGFGGLATCGSVWACPVCSARIQAVRRLELGVLVAAAEPRGTIAFGTVTLRHKKGQSLAKLWDALSACNKRVGQDKGVRALRKELGRYGYVRATEVTHGRNGWHPHIHSVNLFEGNISQEQLDRLAEAEFRAWRAAAKFLGLGEPLRSAQMLRKVTDAKVEFADYFAKSCYDETVARSAKTMSYEMSGNMTKAGRGQKSRTPWQILADFQRDGDLDDWDLWEEYEKASKGRRALVWSPGLKAEFGIGEKADEEIADEEVGTSDDILFLVTDWSPVARNSILGGQLLGEVRRGGLKAGLAFCLAEGIPVELLSHSDDEEDEE
ncbi:hypothetical protein ABIB35_003757 [Arthrobacter sp. UYP6]|uniref:protein rep n=1 Tax=Arthrobacter sp. UYP6 TaxID=1756378 RepID=UPI003397949F